MQEIYEYIQECDNVLIASPIYFSELTGALLNVGSRLQTYFCAKFFRKELHHMNTYDILPAVISHDTNNRPAVNDETTLAGVNNIIGFFIE